MVLGTFIFCDYSLSLSTLPYHFSTLELRRKDDSVLKVLVWKQDSIPYIPIDILRDLEDVSLCGMHGGNVEYFEFLRLLVQDFFYINCTWTGNE